MSENTPTPSDLVEEISFTVSDASVIPVPIDPTLSIQGEAADAKATGDAIAGVIGNLRVNTKAPVSNAITLYGTDIAVSNATGAGTVAAAIEAAASRTASDMMYDTDELITVKGAIDDIYDKIDEIVNTTIAGIVDTTLESELSTSEIDDILDDVFGGDD